MSKNRFSPYVNNGGTVLGVAGKDFVVIGADTRQSDGGYGINTRQSSKFVKLTDKCVLASSGMNADINTLHRTLEARLVQYEHANNKKMPAPAVAQLLFFPYYTFNVLGGLNDKGEGCIWSYDAVGSFELSQYSASGTGQTLVIPLLDNQVGRKNQLNVVRTEYSLAETVDLVKDAFATAGERDIYTGDYVDILIITKDGVRQEKMELRFD